MGSDVQPGPSARLHANNSGPRRYASAELWHEQDGYQISNQLASNMLARLAGSETCCARATPACGAWLCPIGVRCVVGSARARDSQGLGPSLWAEGSHWCGQDRYRD